MNTKKINRLLNQEQKVKMDGCAVLVLMMTILEKISNDEELAPMLVDRYLFDVAESESLSSHGRMLMSAGAYVATAAANIFGDKYVEDLLDGNHLGMKH